MFGPLVLLCTVVTTQVKVKEITGDIIMQSFLCRAVILSFVPSMNDENLKLQKECMSKYMLTLHLICA